MSLKSTRVHCHLCAESSEGIAYKMCVFILSIYIVFYMYLFSGKQNVYLKSILYDNQRYTKVIRNHNLTSIYMAFLNAIILKNNRHKHSAKAHYRGLWDTARFTFRKTATQITLTVLIKVNHPLPPSLIHKRAHSSLAYTHTHPHTRNLSHIQM